MSKKPTVSLLEAAVVKDVAAPMPPKLETIQEPAQAPVTKPLPPYAAILAKYPCDPDARAFLVEQIDSAISWGTTDNIIRVPQELFMAMIDDLKDKQP